MAFKLFCTTLGFWLQSESRAASGKEGKGGAGGMSKQTKVEVTAISQGVLVSLEAEEKKDSPMGVQRKHSSGLSLSV